MSKEREPWVPLPEFATRLAEAMRAAGFNADGLAERVQELGVTCTRQHIDRLREGSSSNPSARLVHAISVACSVDVTYFFVQQVPASTRRSLLDRSRGTGFGSGP